MDRFLKVVRRLSPFIGVLLVVEFLDEFVGGAREASWPVIRSDLNLSYEQIGFMLMLPELLANVVFEPVLGILGDVWKRRVLILGGGIFFALSTFLVAMSQNYLALLMAFIIFYPASGAFVSLSQSTLMDIEPKRHEQNMARWTFAGSLGLVFGALVVGVFINLGAGWRGFYVLVAILTIITVFVMRRMVFPAPIADEDGESISFRVGIRRAFAALRRREVVRWSVLLEFSDLMLDTLHGYLALYFVDVVGVSEQEAVLAVAIWTGVGLLGDFLLIPLLERVRGLTYLRFSAALELVLYSAFLLVPGVTPKLILIGLIGFFNAGWYSILKGNLYIAMPGQSGTVMTLGNLFGTASSFIPLIIGLVAAQFGLSTAMAFPLIACVALLIWLPRR
jgi:FSR family fosmidomycin resistance protein-like MFS transporter